MFQNIYKAVAVTLIVLFSSTLFAAQIVNINKADAVTIAENLNGIGNAKAKAIIAYRSLHGDFRNIDDLVRVKGIGAKLVERNRELISFDAQTPDPVVSPEAVKDTEAATSASLPTAGAESAASVSGTASN